MGKRGPAKTPTKLALVKGERADRINDTEPEPEGQVAPPGWLSDDALEVWRRYAPDLQRKQVLTAWDVEAFGNFCDAVVRRARASQALDDEGEIVDLPVFNKNGDHTGDRKGKNPWALIWKEADGQVQRWGARFGMTPSDRTSISVGEETRGGPKEDLLTG